jgi:hypothetical protein
LAQALKLDMTEYWQPSTEGYFEKVPKALILDAVREGIIRRIAAPHNHRSGWQQHRI